jgi:hypothetical protein
MTYLSLFIFTLNMFVVVQDYRRNVFNFATMLNIIAAGLFALNIIAASLYIGLYVKV